MANPLQSAYDQAAKADHDAQERLEKILRPNTKVSKKQPLPKQTWLEETPLIKPKKQKPSGLRTKQELSGYSANQRWRLAKKFASERMAEEMGSTPETELTPVLE
jgi:hypothetical protein